MSKGISTNAWKRLGTYRRNSDKCEGKILKFFRLLEFVGLIKHSFRAYTFSTLNMSKMTVETVQVNIKLKIKIAKQTILITSTINVSSAIE